MHSMILHSMILHSMIDVVIQFRSIPSFIYIFCVLFVPIFKKDDRLQEAQR